MPQPPVDVASELRRLQAAYIDSLGSRAEELLANLAAWLDSGDRAAGEGLHRLAHALTGAGDTYGLRGLSSAARELAASAEALLEQGDVPSAAVSARLRQLAADVVARMRGAPSSRESLAPGRSERDPALGKDKRALLLRGATNPERSLERLLTSGGYSLHTERLELLTEDPEGSEEAGEWPLVLVDQSGISTPALRARVQALCASGVKVASFGGDGGFRARLDALRLGVGQVLVPPYDQASIAELDALSGFDSGPPGRVLVIDDDEAFLRASSEVLTDARLLVETLSDPYLVLEVIDRFRPNLVLLDVQMPKCSGIDIARVIRQRDDLVGMSILFLSGDSSWQVQQQAMSAGADDFLLKPLDADGLSAAVLGRMRRLRGLDRHIAKDSLTQLVNQGTFKERVKIEVARTVREKAQLSLSLIDLDHFKAVNDTHGHAAGDRVLCTLAQLLRGSVRQTDTVARCGGEEFGVLLPAADEQSAIQVMDRIRSAFQGITHASAFGEFHVSLSCGVASLADGMTPATLYEWADRALYLAKAGGRNRVLALPEADRRAARGAVLVQSREPALRGSSSKMRALRGR